MGEPAVENVFETQDPYYITNENAKFENTRVYTAGIW
jgi:PHD/YefM family antitoxin component YafN of YafNO toxin-antitoxin module